MVPLCIAHRGASAERPENTSAAFHRAIEVRCDGVELDVQLTKDGIPVVFHDLDLMRLTGRRGNMRKLDLKEVDQLSVSGEKIPTLAEVLRLIARETMIQIEIKKGTSVAPVIDCIQKARATERVVLASFETAILREAFFKAPQIPRMLIADRPRFRSDYSSANFLLRRMASAGASGISVDFLAITSERFVRVVKNRGAVLWGWTVNREKDMRRLIGWGVDAILTDDPRVLRQLLDSDRRIASSDKRRGRTL